MGEVAIELASVSKSGILNLPRRVRNILGIEGPARVVFIADPQTKQAIVLPESEFRVQTVGLVSSVRVEIYLTMRSGLRGGDRRNASPGRRPRQDERGIRPGQPL